MILSKPAGPDAALGVLRFQPPLTFLLINHALRVVLPGLPQTANLLPHPILTASWVGLFVTSLNLIPAGQLDGGHILYGISPRWHRRIAWLIPLLLLGMGITLWTGWLLWAGVLLVPAMRHSHVDLYPEPSSRQRMMGWIALALLALTLLPAPFAQTGLISLLH
jgi:membrane-associated protease RseP (regulator of RpoE activity)